MMIFKSVPCNKKNSVVQISQGKNHYILYDKKGNHIIVKRSKKLDAAFGIGRWQLFHDEWLKQKGEKK
jgi:hypothetical protein